MICIGNLLLLLHIYSPFNTSYLTDSYIVFTLKLESGQKKGEFDQVHMAKEIFPIFLHAGRWLVLVLNLKKMASAWRNFKNIFSRPLFTIIFRPKIVILDTDSILRVKTMYESVK